jgi:branched-chain amino acid transport system substrate-binding protein
MIAPAMPIAIQKDRLFLGLFGLAVNSEFHYPKYFSMLPTGPDPKHAFSDPFFKVAMAKEPKPKTLAIVAADAEYPKHASEGARDTAKSLGLQVVYDKSYPPSTADYSPIVRAIQATNPEIVFVASYPPDSAGMLRAATEMGLKTRYFGGGMVGLQFTSIKQQFGPKLNGIVNYDFWIPTPRCSSGHHGFLKKYQAKAPGEGSTRWAGICRPSPTPTCRSWEAIEVRRAYQPSPPIASQPFVHHDAVSLATMANGEAARRRRSSDHPGQRSQQLKYKTEVILEPGGISTGEVVEPYATVKKKRAVYGGRGPVAAATFPTHRVYARSGFSPHQCARILRCTRSAAGKALFAAKGTNSDCWRRWRRPSARSR